MAPQVKSAGRGVSADDPLQQADAILNAQAAEHRAGELERERIAAELERARFAAEKAARDQAAQQSANELHMKRVIADANRVKAERRARWWSALMPSVTIGLTLGVLIHLHISSRKR